MMLHMVIFHQEIDARALPSHLSSFSPHFQIDKSHLSANNLSHMTRQHHRLRIGKVEQVCGICGDNYDHYA